MKKPYINWMYPGYKEVKEEDFSKRKIRISIFETKRPLLDDYECYLCQSSDCYGECEDDIEESSKWDWDLKHKLPLLKIDLGEINFQTVLDRLPEGTSPSEVKVCL